MKYLRLRDIKHPRRLLGELRGRQRLQKQSDLWQALVPILQAAKSTGCTYFELEALYSHIVRHRPSTILELGSGISTIVMGFAAKHVRSAGQACTIISMEENGK